ncbi:MAG: Ig-like domain-containing protein, partial [Rhodoferax sp.]|nr:Ig-like domain-containing protein [Rhodoferax sp.]
ITFSFSETPSSFDSSDISVTGGTLGPLIGSGSVRTASFTPTAGIDSSTASISVAGGENSYTDAAGNPGGAGSTPLLTVDTRAPTLSITSSQSVVKANETATITFSFSETPTGFVSSDISVSGGTLGTLSGSGSVRTAIFTPTDGIDSTPASITVAANRYTDAAGNNGGAGTKPSLTVDTRAPTLSITSSATAVKAGENATITFRFSEDPGSSFTWNGNAGAINVTGGTLGSLSGSGSVRTAIFTPTADTNNGSASISVAASSYTDAAGNNGGAGNAPTITYDTKAPTLSITSDKSVLKEGETATITFTFSETPSGFDYHVTDGGTLGTLSGSGSVRTATFTPTAGTDSTPVSISVAAGNYSDAAGNPGSAGTTPMLTVDTKAPTLAITSDKSALKAGETATLTFTFSETPTDFDSSDISVSGSGTLGTLSGNGSVRTATFTPAADTDHGSASISVAASSYTDLAGNNGGAGSATTITFDTKAPGFSSSATAPSLAENTAAGHLVYTAAATDMGSAITYSLKAGIDDASAFTINSSTGAVTLTASPDFETKPSYSFTVIATDAAGNATEQAVALEITNVNEAPTVKATAPDSKLFIANSGAATLNLSDVFQDVDAGD